MKLMAGLLNRLMTQHCTFTKVASYNVEGKKVMSGVPLRDVPCLVSGQKMQSTGQLGDTRSASFQIQFADTITPTVDDEVSNITDAEGNVLFVRGTISSVTPLTDSMSGVRFGWYCSVQSET